MPRRVKQFQIILMLSAIVSLGISAVVLGQRQPLLPAPGASPTASSATDSSATGGPAQVAPANAGATADDTFLPPISARTGTPTPAVGPVPLAAPASVASPEKAAAIADARQLSVAFRSVAKMAIPAVVTIEVRSRPVQVSRGSTDEFEFGPEGQLGELFRSDPRLREFFRGGSVPRRQSPARTGQGSGFIIDSSGVIMTNHHVIDSASQVTVRLGDGREYEAIDIKSDPKTDVAVLRIRPDAPLPALQLGNSDSTEIGDWVIAVGSPFGQEMTVTAGIVSGKSRGPGITEREEFLQTDAAINPGNSGGPLLNLDGEVVGINTAISTRSGGYDGVGFAIPSQLARWVADQLLSTGSVRRAYLGAGIQQVDSELARQFGVPVGQGALVTQVMPNTPAEKARLQAGDLITQVNGENVANVRGLQALVEKLPVNQPVPFTVLRNGRVEQIPVMAEEMPKGYSLKPQRNETNGPTESEAPARKEAAFKDFGITVEPLTAEMAEQLGAREHEGVVVTEVDADSPAGWAGLTPGLMIEKVGNKSVQTVDEFRAAMENASADKGIVLLVRDRDGRHRFIVLRSQTQLPEAGE